MNKIICTWEFYTSPLDFVYVGNTVLLKFFFVLVINH